uniref:phosphoribosylamine--glycine ligase n=1 Tax=Vibrio cholerae TaxID=666 RepID=UPI003F58D4D0
MGKFKLSLKFVLEKPFFSDYFSHAKRLREIFCNKLVRIRAIQIAADKVFPKWLCCFCAVRL